MFYPYLQTAVSAAAVFQCRDEFADSHHRPCTNNRRRSETNSFEIQV
jgi:hypothetical protein